MDSVTLIAVIPLLAFCLFLSLQYWWPRRPQSLFSKRVWHNLYLFIFNLVVSRLLLPISLVGVATIASDSKWGLLQQLPIPYFFEVLIAIILLDLAIYWQHVATHKIPLLWRIHKVHHADHEMDVTTAVRFHPLELLLSFAYKAAVIMLLGAPLLAVVIFVLLLFIGPAFNHSNLRVSSYLDRYLRWVIATPDVHRTHHSILRHEQDMNYGFFLIWWDRLFGTYQAAPSAGHDAMQIGLKAAGENDQSTIRGMLIAPFVR